MFTNFHSCIHICGFAAVDKGGENQPKIAYNELYRQLFRHVSPLAAGM